MSIETKVFAALSPLVGVDARGMKCCYPVILPQEPTYPAIVFQVTSADPSARTQSARLSDWTILVTIYGEDKDAILALRSSVLTAVLAMAEHKTHTELGDGFEFEAKLFSWKFNFEFRDSET